MNTAGMLLDFYDDVSGRYFKKAFPTISDVPEIVKEAHILTQEEHDVLRDEAYALRMNVDGKILRKFACVDEGNTVLSVLYFLENFDKLPANAIKVAAQNLNDFCEEFNLPVPTTIKLAAKSGMARTRNPVKQPIVGDDADWSQRTNLVSIQGGGDGGRVIPIASQMKTAESVQGGVVLTTDKRHVGVKQKIPKLNTTDDINLDSFHRLNPEAKPKNIVLPLKEEFKEPGKKNFFSKKKQSSPVDISGEALSIVVQEHSKEITALDGKYSLDSMANTQKAVEYFEENYKTMEPIEAHIFAVKTASRAAELGVAVSDTLSRYGSTTYANDVEAHIANRIACTEKTYHNQYNELREKQASMHPEEFAESLAKIDEESGAKWYYGGEIADPYYATFDKVSSSWSWQSRTGDFVSEDDLLWLARNGRPLVHKHFASDVVNGFTKDPKTVFESLPDDSKILLARLASGRFDGLSSN